MQNLKKNLKKKKEQKISISNDLLRRTVHFNPASSPKTFFHSIDPVLKQICLQGIILMLLIVSTILVYGNVGSYEFVNYDDPAYVSENSYIQDGLTLKNIAWAFTTTCNSNWHPITWLSHMLDIDLFGLNAGCHHLMNLFIHICNTLLLYFLFRKSTGDIYKSAVLAAFFALHPLHVESVAWIAERKDLLCGFFWLTAMLAYYLYAQRPSLMRYLLAFFCFILGSLSKPMMVTFPFALLLLFDYWPLKRHMPFNNISAFRFKKNPWIWLIIEKIPLIVVSVIISFVALLTQSKGGSMADIPIFIRITNALMSYVIYIKKMIWPGDLSVIYPLAMPSLWLSAACFMVISGVLTSAFVIRQKHPYLLSGFLWYLGTLIPVIGIVQVGSQAMADRYTYIPSIGIFVAIIWGVSAVVSRFISDKFLKKTILSVVTITALILMMLLSSKQIQYWQNSITLMSNAIHVTKKNYIAHENLGLALTNRGLNDEGLYHFKQVIAINPNFANAYMNIGSYHLLREEYDMAIKLYQKAIALDAGLVKAHVLLGKALNSIGKPIEAQIYIKKAHEIDSVDIY